MHVLYPLARMGRGLFIGEVVYRYSDSLPCAGYALICTDVVSIVLDARPFFQTCSQFFMAAFFLPWFFDSYWEQFVAQANKPLYTIEVIRLYTFIGLTFGFG